MMSADSVKKALINKYKNSALDETEIDILIECVESTYINRAFPFSSNKSQEEVDWTWVLKACISILERGEIDLTQYTENALSNSIGASLMSEITPHAGVPQSKKSEV